MIVEEQDQLRKLVEEKYQNLATKKIKPMFPYVLVRLLPKSQKVGSLFVPDQHNKVLHEGIVLETFTPFWRQVRKKTSDVSEVRIECEVKPGDHILFQHFEGIPVEHAIFSTPYYKSQEYLLVSADPVGGGRNGIVGVIEGCEEAGELLWKFIARLGLDMSTLSSYGRRATQGEAALKTLVENFVISPIGATSKTLSGK